jgi:hypothetical protein
LSNLSGQILIFRYDNFTANFIKVITPDFLIKPDIFQLKKPLVL